jgi:hypothetical protein
MAVMALGPPAPPELPAFCSVGVLEHDDKATTTPTTPNAAHAYLRTRELFKVRSDYHRQSARASPAFTAEFFNLVHSAPASSRA